MNYARTTCQDNPEVLFVPLETPTAQNAFVLDILEITAFTHACARKTTPDY